MFVACVNVPSVSINCISNTVWVQVYSTRDVAKICKVEVLKYYGAPMKIGCHTCALF